MEQTIKLKTWGGFVKSISGLFITKDNPNGLTYKEQQFIAVLLSQAGSSNVVTKEIKTRLSNHFNQSMQVTVNYINKLKKKGVIQKDDHIHPIFFNSKVSIVHGE